jgi:hypothetical protein
MQPLKGYLFTLLFLSCVRFAASVSSSATGTGTATGTATGTKTATGTTSATRTAAASPTATASANTLSATASPSSSADPSSSSSASPSTSARATSTTGAQPDNAPNVTIVARPRVLSLAQMRLLGSQDASGAVWAASPLFSTNGSGVSMVDFETHWISSPLLLSLTSTRLASSACADGGTNGTARVCVDLGASLACEDPLSPTFGRLRLQCNVTTFAVANLTDYIYKPPAQFSVSSNASRSGCSLSIAFEDQVYGPRASPGTVARLLSSCLSVAVKYESSGPLRGDFDVALAISGVEDERYIAGVVRGEAATQAGGNSYPGFPLPLAVVASPPILSFREPLLMGLAPFGPIDSDVSAGVIDDGVVVCSPAVEGIGSNLRSLLSSGISDPVLVSGVNLIAARVDLEAGGCSASDSFVLPPAAVSDFGGTVLQSVFSGACPLYAAFNGSRSAAEYLAVVGALNLVVDASNARPLAAAGARSDVGFRNVRLSFSSSGYSWDSTLLARIPVQPVNDAPTWPAATQFVLDERAPPELLLVVANNCGAAAVNVSRQGRYVNGAPLVLCLTDPDPVAVSSHGVSSLLSAGTGSAAGALAVTQVSNYTVTLEGVAASDGGSVSAIGLTPVSGVMLDCSAALASVPLFSGAATAPDRLPTPCWAQRYAIRRAGAAWNWEDTSVSSSFVLTFSVADRFLLDPSGGLKVVTGSASITIQDVDDPAGIEWLGYSLAADLAASEACSTAGASTCSDASSSAVGWSSSVSSLYGPATASPGSSQLQEILVDEAWSAAGVHVALGQGWVAPGYGAVLRLSDPDASDVGHHFIQIVGISPADNSTALGLRQASDWFAAVPAGYASPSAPFFYSYNSTQLMHQAAFTLVPLRSLSSLPARALTLGLCIFTTSRGEAASSCRSRSPDATVRVRIVRRNAPISFVDPMMTVDLAEASPVGTVVLAITPLDADPAQSFTFSLGSGAAVVGRSPVFALVPQNSTLQVFDPTFGLFTTITVTRTCLLTVAADAIDFESTPSYFLNVSVVDDGRFNASGAPSAPPTSASVLVSITVLDLPDAPTVRRIEHVPEGGLSVSGGDLIDIVGTSLGLPLGPSSAPALSLGDAAANISWAFAPGACSLVTRLTRLRCTTPIGYGAGLGLLVAVSGQGLNESVPAPPTLSFSVPRVTSASYFNESGLSDVPTPGSIEMAAAGGLLVIRGSGFSPAAANETGAFVVNLIRGNASGLSILSSGVVAPPGSTAVDTPVMSCALQRDGSLVCPTILEGAGADLQVEVILHGRSSRTVFVSFATPLITGLAQMLAGETDAWRFRIAGLNFGRGADQDLDFVQYAAQPATTAVQPQSARCIGWTSSDAPCTIYTAQRCTMLSRSVLSCGLDPSGWGAGFSVRLSVGGIISAWSESSLGTLSYPPPAVFYIAPVNSASVSGLSIDYPQVEGGTLVGVFALGVPPAGTGAVSLTIGGVNAPAIVVTGICLPSGVPGVCTPPLARAVSGLTTALAAWGWSRTTGNGTNSTNTTSSLDTMSASASAFPSFASDSPSASASGSSSATASASEQTASASGSQPGSLTASATREVSSTASGAPLTTATPSSSSSASASASEIGASGSSSASESGLALASGSSSASASTSAFASFLSLFSFSSSATASVSASASSQDGAVSTSSASATALTLSATATAQTLSATASPIASLDPSMRPSASLSGTATASPGVSKSPSPSSSPGAGPAALLSGAQGTLGWSAVYAYAPPGFGTVSVILNIGSRSSAIALHYQPLAYASLALAANLYSPSSDGTPFRVFTVTGQGFSSCALCLANTAQAGPSFGQLFQSGVQGTDGLCFGEKSRERLQSVCAIPDDFITKPSSLNFTLDFKGTAGVIASVDWQSRPLGTQVTVVTAARSGDGVLQLGGAQVTFPYTFSTLSATAPTVSDVSGLPWPAGGGSAATITLKRAGPFGSVLVTPTGGSAPEGAVLECPTVWNTVLLLRSADAVSGAYASLPSMLAYQFYDGVSGLYLLKNASTPGACPSGACFDLTASTVASGTFRASGPVLDAANAAVVKDGSGNRTVRSNAGGGEWVRVPQLPCFVKEWRGTTDNAGGSEFYTIVLVTPAWQGLATVSIARGGEVSLNALDISFQAPLVSAVLPQSTLPSSGGLITISGANFGASSSLGGLWTSRGSSWASPSAVPPNSFPSKVLLRFSTMAAADEPVPRYCVPVSWSDTSIVCRAPPAPPSSVTSAVILVATGGAAAAPTFSSSTFDVTTSRYAVAGPLLTSISPSSLGTDGGYEVEIAGTNQGKFDTSGVPCSTINSTCDGSDGIWLDSTGGTVWQAYLVISAVPGAGLVEGSNVPLSGKGLPGGPIAIPILLHTHDRVRFVMPALEGRVMISLTIESLKGLPTTVTSPGISYTTAAPTISAIAAIASDGYDDDPCLALNLLRPADSCVMNAVTLGRNITRGVYPLFASQPCFRSTVARSNGARTQLAISGRNFGSGKSPISTVTVGGVSCISAAGLSGSVLISSTLLQCAMLADLPSGPAPVVVSIAFRTALSADAGIVPVAVCKCGDFAATNGSLCAPCPTEGAQCAGALEQPRAIQDYWETNPTTNPTQWQVERFIDAGVRKVPRFAPCAVQGACLADQQCAPGFDPQSWQCIQCIGGFNKGADGLCSECTKTEAWQAPAILAILCSAGFLGIAKLLLAADPAIAAQQVVKLEEKVKEGTLLKEWWKAAGKAIRVGDTAKKKETRRAERRDRRAAEKALKEDKDELAKQKADALLLPQTMPLIKLLLTYAQTMAAISAYADPSKLKVRPPQPGDPPFLNLVPDILRQMSAVQSLGTNIKAFSCSLSMKYSTKIVSWMVLPIVTFFGLGFMVCLTLLFTYTPCYRCCKCSKFFPPRTTLIQNGLSAIAFFVFLVLPASISALAQAQNCDDSLGFKNFLIDEPRVSCQDPSFRDVYQSIAAIVGYSFLFIPVVVAAVLYPLRGIPGVSFRCCKREPPPPPNPPNPPRRGRLHCVKSPKEMFAVDKDARDAVRNVFKSLASGYDTEDKEHSLPFIWECLVLLRKLLFTGLGTGFLFLQDPRTQAGYVGLLLTLSFALHLAVWPYASPVVNILESISLGGCTVFTFAIFERLASQNVVASQATSFKSNSSISAKELAFFDLPALALFALFFLLWIVVLFDVLFLKGARSVALMKHLQLDRRDKVVERVIVEKVADGGLSRPVEAWGSSTSTFDQSTPGASDSSFSHVNPLLIRRNRIALPPVHTKGAYASGDNGSDLDDDDSGSDLSDDDESSEEEEVPPAVVQVLEVLPEEQAHPTMRLTGSFARRESARRPGGAPPSLALVRGYASDLPSAMPLGRGSTRRLDAAPMPLRMGPKLAAILAAKAFAKAGEASAAAVAAAAEADGTPPASSLEAALAPEGVSPAKARLMRLSSDRW